MRKLQCQSKLILRQGSVEKAVVFNS